MKKKLLILLIIIFAVLLGMWIQYTFNQPTQNNTPSATIKKKIKYWVAPMDPNYRRDKPGKSPMGMDLVPVYENPLTDEQGSSIKISPTVVNNIGVKISTVKMMDLPRLINTVGYVSVDENNIFHVHSLLSGWIKQLNVKTTGEYIKKGQLLYAIYSPEIINAQEEYLLALSGRNKIIIDGAKQKLQALGMSLNQINLVKKNNRADQLVNIYAKTDGIIAKLSIREGMYVTPDKEIMSIENLSHIWIIADVFERLATWFNVGDDAKASLDAYPGKVWAGKVDFIYPTLDRKTRSLKVRLVFPNPDLSLKPNMFANITILGKPIHNTIGIPTSALIRTGDGDRVIIALGDGKFTTQSVTIGIESGHYYQITRGLKAGDKVVTSAQFLIDSEANTLASLKRMNSDQHQKSSTKPIELIGMGKVTKINRENRTITLDHEPIKAINMPAMTMTFTVANKVDLKRVNVGDNIHFVMKHCANDHYELTMIHVIKDETHSH